MWLHTCGDPECPNKARVKELEAELEQLKKQLSAARETLARNEDTRQAMRFKYPD